MAQSFLSDNLESDLRIRSSYGLALFALVVITPVAVNNFMHGRLLSGTTSVIIMLLLGLNAWNTRRSVYKPQLTFFVLVPLLIIFLSVTIRAQGIIGIFWSYPVLLSFYIMLPERNAWIANIALLLVVIPLAFIELDVTLTTRIAATLLTVSVFAAMFIRIISEQQGRMRALADTDPLTGVLNRTSLVNTLDDALRQFNSHSLPMTLLSLDLDSFKAINDTLGHDAGDKVLQKTGRLLQTVIRQSDYVYRVGGEEFLILLAGSDQANSARIAENIRSMVESTQFLDDRTVTASIGVASLTAGETTSQWLKRADNNLYKAKHNGRNRVVI